MANIEPQTAVLSVKGMKELEEALSAFGKALRNVQIDVTWDKEENEND